MLDLVLQRGVIQFMNNYTMAMNGKSKINLYSKEWQVVNMKSKTMQTIFL
jgi:hypothetical protein